MHKAQNAKSQNIVGKMQLKYSVADSGPYTDILQAKRNVIESQNRNLGN